MKLSWLKLVLCFAVLLVVSATGAQDVTKSLIGNGDFELDRNSDQWPDGWARPKAGGSWEVEGDNHFLRLASPKHGEMVLLHQELKLPADVRAVELTWKQRITNLKPGKQAWFDARVMIEFKSATGEKVKGAPSAPYSRKNTDGWVDRKIQFLIPEDARTMELMPTLFQVESGTFDLDDIALKPVDAAPLQEAAQIAAAATKEKQMKAAAGRRAKADAALKATGSLISNGNFELDQKSDSWPDDWGRLKSGGSWEVEGGDKNHFLRLNSDTPGETVLLYRSIDLSTGVQALEFSWRQRITNLKPGKEPYFDARIMLEFKDAAGAKLNQKPSPPYARGDSKGWVEKRVQFLVPDDALTLEFMPALFQVQRGTFDLDDIVLKPIEAAPLIAAAKVAADAERAARVDPEEPMRSKWPLELHVVGNQILNAKDQPVWLQGVNVVSLEWSLTGEKVMKSALVAVTDWKANTIRLPVKEEYWFGRAGGQKDGGASYRLLVDQIITLVANRGGYVVLDLHRFRAPNEAHLEFWKDAATKYKNHSAVLFDLFNEPHGISWEVWRNGGFVMQDNKPADEDAFLSPEEKAKAAAQKGFQSPGMQKLLDAVRATGARNIVIVGGLDWAYDLSGIAKGFGLTEEGGNGIVYSTHIYPWKRDWAGKVLLVAEKHPIFVGEVGADAKKMTFIPAEAQEDADTWVPEMLGLIQKYKLHWTAFSFHTSASPVMLKDWEFTPTSYWGQPAKDALSGKPFELNKLR